MNTAGARKLGGVAKELWAGAQRLVEKVASGKAAASLGEDARAVAAVAHGDVPAAIGAHATSSQPHRITVIVAENSDYANEAARYKLGDYADVEEAVAAAKQVIDEFLAESYQAGMTAEQLFAQYKLYGLDPFVMAKDGGAFSGWSYAKQRTHDIAK